MFELLFFSSIKYVLMAFCFLVSAASSLVYFLRLDYLENPKDRSKSAKGKASAQQSAQAAAFDYSELDDEAALQAAEAVTAEIDAVELESGAQIQPEKDAITAEIKSEQSADKSETEIKPQAKEAKAESQPVKAEAKAVQKKAPKATKAEVKPPVSAAKKAPAQTAAKPKAKSQKATQTKTVEAKSTAKKAADAPAVAQKSKTQKAQPKAQKAAEAQNPKTAQKAQSAKTQKSKAEAKTALEKKAAKPQVKKPSEPLTEEEKQAKIYGKYLIKEVAFEDYQFELYDNKGKLLFQSVSYSSREACEKYIGFFKNHVKTGTFAVENYNGAFFFTLKRGLTSYSGASQKTQAAAEKQIEAVKEFSQSAVIVVKQ
jgi:hypothetical protein